MKFPEPKTFRGAMSPVIIIRWVLGIGTFEYPTGRPRRGMSLCWSGMILISFVYVIQITALKNVWDRENSPLSKATHHLFLIGTIIYGIMIVYLGQVGSKSLVDSLCELDKVNKLLNKFWILKEYRSIFKSQIIHIIGTSLFILSLTLVPSILILENFSISLIGSIIIGQYVMLVNFIEDYTFSTSIRYIGKRFRHLNAYLSKIKDGNAEPFFLSSKDHIPWIRSTALENNIPSRFVASAEKQWMIRILQNAKKIHCDLCNTAKNLNEVFGIQILLSMAMAVASITTILYNTYFLILMITPTVTDTWIWIRITTNLHYIGFYTLKIFYVVSTCAMASTEAHETGDLIHELVNPTTCGEIREEIHAFALQLIQDPLHFTAYGFFSLDETMIRAVVGTVTTYLVFMIQMPHTSDRFNSSPTNAIISAMNSTV